MPNRRTFLLAGGALALGGGATAAALTRRIPELPPARVFAAGCVAIHGTDPVAYFTEAAPVPGDAGVTHGWAGATWRFATVENRDRFAANPVAFAPRYGGFCAWAIAARGQFFTTQPRNWAVVDGRLYLNFNDDVQAAWDADRAGFIAAADVAWPVLTAAV